EGGSWPERSMTIQRNWIGRSEGAEILFRVEELDIDLPVFTTRPDTLFGATFFVVAPEHPFVEQHGSDEVREYAKHAGARRAEDRAAEEAKTGVFTGYHATNPVNGEQLPVYVADYVLMDYGTGAIMAVPGHDDRDFAFATAFALPITRVVARGVDGADEPLSEAETSPGVAVNSSNDEVRLDGMPTAEAKAA